MTEQPFVPWSQGRTLRTPQTFEWPKKMWDENEAKERLLLFRGFISEDLGRSRELLAEFRNPVDCAHAAACVNAVGDRSPADCVVLEREHLDELYRAAHIRYDYMDHDPGYPTFVRLRAALDAAKDCLETKESPETAQEQKLVAAANAYEAPGVGCVGPKLRARIVSLLEHPPPPPPDHRCGDPNAMCDCACEEWAAYCEEAQEVLEALRGPFKPPTKARYDPKPREYDGEENPDGDHN